MMLTGPLARMKRAVTTWGLLLVCSLVIGALGTCVD
jgi:hypothetical protein